MFIRKSSIGKTVLGLGLLLVAAVALTGCFVGGNITAEETISQSFETGATPRVVAETFNGEINVLAAEAGQVSVDVIKRGAGFSRAEAEDDLANVEVTLTQEGDTVRIVARRLNAAFNVGNSGATIELSVPAGATLELSSSNGEVTASGVTGDVQLNTSNGDVEVRDGAGRLDLGTSNGSVTIDAQAAVVDAHTSNGSIDFVGSVAEGNHSFRTSNGRIKLTLPAAAGFRLDASTSNGKVTTDFAINRTSPDDDDNELRGTVGENTSVSITASSSNGSIEIRSEK
ncbi:MAG TPA: DUF4097 family beta strand repeat-containing protein [Anaerolineae bacterium]|nr:DUF4097 family beta strand repeat-containing protein [Anaerolineae bacterium]